MTTSRQQAERELLGQVETLISYRRRALCAQPLFREVSLPQLHILMTLQNGGRMTLSELAHALGISAPSASAIVDRMEEHGMVSRIRNDLDRRVVHVDITAKGQAVATEMMGLKQDRMQNVLDAMTDSELHTVSVGITALCSVLDRLAASELAGADMRTR